MSPPPLSYSKLSTHQLVELLPVSVRVTVRGLFGNLPNVGKAERPLDHLERPSVAFRLDDREETVAGGDHQEDSEAGELEREEEFVSAPVSTRQAFEFGRREAVRAPKQL